MSSESIKDAIIDNNNGSSNRTLAVQPVLELFFEKTEGGDYVKRARDEIRFRALELCNNDHCALDENNLPLNAGLFRALELRLSRFLAASNVSLALYDRLDPNDNESIRIIGQINKKKNPSPSKRGNLLEVFDHNDEVLGTYLSSLENQFTAAGTSSDQLLHGSSALKSKKYKEVLQTCFSVARDMILIIGLEKYDNLREKVGRVLFKIYSSAEITTTPSAELASRHKENYRGYWRQLPRVWVEELMILARNPQLVQQICDDPHIHEKTSVRDYINIMSRQEELRLKKKKLKMTQLEYFKANIDKKEFTDLDHALSLLSDSREIDVPLVEYSKYYSGSDIHAMKTFIKMVIGRHNIKRSLHAMHNFCAVFSKYDDVFRSVHNAAVLKSSAIVDPKTLASARANLRKLPNLQQRKLEVQHADSQYTFIVRTQLTDDKIDKQGIDVFYNNPPRILCKDVPEKDVAKTFETMDELKNKIGSALEMFQEMEQKIKNTPLKRSPEEIYAEYAENYLSS